MINVYDGFSAGEYMKKKILLALLASAAALTGCANMESLGSDQEVVAAANQLPADGSEKHHYSPV